MAGGAGFSFGIGGGTSDRARFHVIKTGHGPGLAERFRVVHEVPILGGSQGTGFHFISTVELPEHEVRTVLESAGTSPSEIDAALADARTRFEEGKD